MSQKFPVIILRPHRLQIVAENMGSILCLTLFFVLAGWDGLLPNALFPFLTTAAAILLANLFCKYLYLSRVRYTINEEQLQYEYGIFSIQRDYIELYRVVDYSEQRSFPQRLFSLKTVSIYSGDKTCPRLDVVCVRNQTDLIKVIRERVEYNKKKRNIHEFTNIR